MKNREKLFNTLKVQIIEPNPYKITSLFHHVYTLKLGDQYVFKNMEDFSELIQFFNEQEN